MKGVSMKRILIRGGELITAQSRYRADILIEGERIAQIREHIEHDDTEVIDARGMMVLPGGVDPHVHLDLPMFNTVSSDDYYSGGKAAAFGGTTTVLDFAPQDFPTLKESYRARLAKSESRASVDYGFPVLVKQGRLEVRRYAEKRGIQTEAAFSDSVLSTEVAAAEKAKTYPNVEQLLRRTLLFPLYPSLGRKDIQLLCKVLSTLP